MENEIRTIIVDGWRPARLRAQAPTAARSRIFIRRSEFSLEAPVHEMALIQNLIALVAADAAKRGIVKIRSVRLVLGELAGETPAALTAAFSSLLPGEPLFAPDARLWVEVRPASLACRACAARFPVPPAAEWEWSCPFCRSGEMYFASGYELHVDSYEGETG